MTATYQATCGDCEFSRAYKSRGAAGAALSLHSCKSTGFSVGTVVRHPLWPELGHGHITSMTEDPASSNPTGRVLWPSGQHTRHSLRVLVVAT